MGKQMTAEAEQRIAQQAEQEMASLVAKVRKTAERMKFAKKQHDAAVAALAKAQKGNA